MKRPTKGYSDQEVALFPTMLDVTEPSTSPSRITSSPSPLPTPSPTPDHIMHQHNHHQHNHHQHNHHLEQNTIFLHPMNHLSMLIGVLEADLKTTKQTYSSAFTKLVLRVKKLEAQVKIGKARRRAKIVHSDDEDIIDDSSKQGRILSGLRAVREGSAEVSTAAEDGCKEESEPKKKSKKELEQERLSFAEAIRLEEQMNEEQRAQIARDEEIARPWDEEERQRAMAEAKTSKKIDWNDPSVIRRGINKWYQSSLNTQIDLEVPSKQGRNNAQIDEDHFSSDGCTDSGEARV
ncbi:hypothetical protein Tco_1162878 [Tanacetum coccineum]